MNQKQSELLEYAIQSFAFILPFNGEFTFQEWADKITAIYDAANVKTSAIVAEIRKFNGKIVRNCGRTTVELS